MLGEEMHRVRDPELVSGVLGTEPAGTVSVLLLRYDLPGTVQYNKVKYSTIYQVVYDSVNLVSYIGTAKSVISFDPTDKVWRIR